MIKEKIIIITAPSGSGKSTLIKTLMEAIPNLRFSISACTRAPREGEIDGKDYHFLSVPSFEKAIEENRFLEWEMVYEGKYYGTLKSELKRIWDSEQIPLVDIDVIGALNVQKEYRNKALSIFIKAPSISVLEQRLINRKTETPESLKERLDKADYELKFAPQFDFTIINDQIEKASKELIELVNSFLNK